MIDAEDFNRRNIKEFRAYRRRLGGSFEGHRFCGCTAPELAVARSG